MKKPKNVSRTKMLMLLSLMFLSIAVLCMGVLAAESATYNIAGNISYNMVDYVARINTRVYKVEGQTDETGLATGIQTLSDMTFEQIERSTDPYYVLSQKLDTGAVTRTSDTTTNITGNVNIEYGAVDSSVEYYTFYVVINIKETTGSYVLSASLNETVSSSTTSYMKSNQSQSGIEKSNTQNIVIGFSLKSATANSTESFSYTLKIGAVKWSAFSVTLTDGGTYWYTELGTLSDGTKVKWQLVSLDGENKYEYTSTKPTKHKGAIFLQKTYLGSMCAFGSDNMSYYNSTIRTNVNTLTTWNLTDSNVSSIIKKRNIRSITGYNTDGSTGETKFTGETDDYFWLLDVGEVETFLGTTEEERRWTPDNSSSEIAFYLRCPNNLRSMSILYVRTDGRNGCCTGMSIEEVGAIRAAFMLSSNTSKGEVIGYEDGGEEEE